ncbi:peptidoglycan-binding protein [Nonomuraea sp. K274]|uniref:Peptidoglycan-binding protein n=1 Tax=Nonomuraea cypriaca TaxID=1187855 RepID=A0A931ADB7_9ACTN|nr:peptidoglycan-binding protein [Nonomuraea cypriaca]MBF8189808.1 peptidoglycan-binding protein [Nonomuraea cypriaca]
MTAGAAVVVVTGPFDGKSEPSAQASVKTSFATVRKGRLSSQIHQSGTLSYVGQADGSPYPVVNHATGIYTRLPRPGQEIKCGAMLYRVEDTPVVLLCGTTPPYRDLSVGDSGRDVRELNTNLVRLGYATRAQLEASSDYFGWRTAWALERLQDKLGAEETGSLKLGQAVTLPGPSRIGKVTARLGASARPGEPIAEATSNGRQVTVDLNPAQQSEVKVGDPVRITLPDNRTTPGVVRRIGTVASSGSDSGSGSGSSTATIPIYITLKRPKDAGRLDHAPVQVEITTGGVENALIVPVTALVTRAGGEFAVETRDAQGRRRPVPVTLGLFDDANGLVQVIGELSAGQQVVVPAT